MKPSHRTEHWETLKAELCNTPFNTPPAPITDEYATCHGYCLNNGSVWEVRLLLCRQPITFARYPKSQRAHAAKLADIATQLFASYRNPNRKHTPRFNYPANVATSFLDSEPAIVNLLQLMEVELQQSGALQHYKPKDEVFSQISRSMAQLGTHLENADRILAGLRHNSNKSIGNIWSDPDFEVHHREFKKLISELCAETKHKLNSEKLIEEVSML